MNDMLTSMILLSADSADGAPIKCQRSGRYCLSANGSFDGATVGISMLGPDGVNYIALEDEVGTIAITAPKALAIVLPAGTFKGTVSSAGGDTSVYLRLDRMID